MNNYSNLMVVITLVLAFYACGGDRSNQSAETTTPVWVEDVHSRTIEEYVTTTGTAKAVKTSEVKSEMNGAYRLQLNPKTGRPYRNMRIMYSWRVKNYRYRLPKKNGRGSRVYWKREERRKKR